MPCPKCGAKLLIADLSNWKTQCPICEQINIVEKQVALKISNDRLSHIDALFKKYITGFKKTRLIAHITWQREKFARAFFDEYQAFDMSRFVAYNYLIKHLMKDDFDGTLDANSQNTNELVREFDRFIGLRNDEIFLQEGFAEMVTDMHCDPDSLTIEEELSPHFKITYTEEFISLSRTFAHNQIYSEEEGKKKIEEYRAEWDSIKERPLKKERSSTPRRVIHDSYPVLNALYCGLISNSMYGDVFDFSNYRGVVEEPPQIMDVANGFPLVAEYFTSTSLAEFRLGLKRVFGSMAITAESVLLFSQQNSETFPLFVLLDGRVIISHRTAFILYLLLHPILLKDYYDAETELRSRELETNKTKEVFEKAGFTYVQHVTDRHNARLEIDGLAGKNGVLYAVEVKGWGLTTFYEHRKMHEYLIRDLKGIVDGIKYSTKYKHKQKKIPSFIEKVQYAASSMNQHGFSQTDFPTVRGLIVTEDFPPINEYKGIKIIGLEEIATLDASSSLVDMVCVV